MSKQDRQGARTPAQLEQEYKFGESFAKVFRLAEDAQKKAEEATALGAKFATEVTRLDDRIEINVIKTEAAQSVADAAQNSANEAKEGIKEQTEVFNQRTGEINQAVTDLRREVGTKAEQSQVSEITEHFRFASDGLTITNSGTGMGINVSEKQVAFTGGVDPTTVITPNAMETTNLQVGVRLDVGGFSLFPRTNKNLSLRWTGG